MAVSGCELSEHPTAHRPLVPSGGTNPLPGVAGRGYKTTGDDSLAATGSKTGGPPVGSATINWSRVKPLLNRVRRQTGSPYVAVYSIRDTSGAYNYKAAPLPGFSSETIKAAGGKVQPYFFEETDRSGAPRQLLAAYIPDSRAALKQMQRWILSHLPVGATVTVPGKKTQRTKAGPAPEPSAGCYVLEIFTTYNFYDDNGNLVVLGVTTYKEVCSGGGGGPAPSGEMPCNPQLLPTADCPASDCPPPNICDVGGGGGSDPCDSANPPDYCATAANAFENRIIDDDLAPCMEDELNELKQIKTGVGEIVQKFAGSPDSLGYNWKIKDGDLSLYHNAQTSQKYDQSTNSVTTTFDSDKFSQATDLSVATVILHEAVHAYIISYFNNDPLEANKTYAELVKDIRDNEYPTQNDDQHAEFVRDFVKDIGSALSEFGSNRGYNISVQYYEELAWSGLTTWPKRDSQGNIIKDSNGNTVYEDTPWFKDKYPDANDRNRIKDEILTEQGYKNDNNQKGNRSGC